MVSPSALAQPHNIALNAENLDLSGARDVRFETLAGRDAMCFSGVALINDQAGGQGRLRADIYNSRARQFANLVFHASDGDNNEDVYLRIHKSGLEDSVQYTPQIKGESHWQLFPNHQAQINFGQADWIGFEVEFNERQARASVHTDHGVEHLDIAELILRGDGEGLGLRSLFGACFSNVSFDPSPVVLNNISAEPIERAGLITQWGLSNAHPFTGFEAVSATSWDQVESEANGTVLISRYRAKAQGGNFEANGVDVVTAGVIVTSESDQTVRLNFDVSDMARIALNGQDLVELNNSFRAKNAQTLFRGDFDINTQTLFLPLRAGENVLTFTVADRANGWGLAARLDPDADVKVRPYLPNQTD